MHTEQFTSFGNLPY